MPSNFCIQNVYKSLSKCGIHFIYKHFLYILYIKVCRNVGYILYTNILYIFCIHFVCKMYTKVCWNVGYICIQTFSIHFVYTSFDVEKVYIINIIYNLYKKFTLNVYANNCIQNGSLISTYFDPFVLHFLDNHCIQIRLETCSLITGVTYQINGLYIALNCQ